MEGHVSGDDVAVVCETTRVFSEEVSHTSVLEVHGCVCMREQSLPVSVVGPREFSQGYKPLTSSGSVLMTIPRVEEVFCPERLSAIRDIKKLSNRLQSQMFSHIC